MRLACLAAAAALPTSTTLAQAGFTTVEPDDFVEGQALNTAVAGVTLSVANGDGVPQEGDQVVAYAGTVASTGTLTFGRQLPAYAPDGSWFLTTIFVHSIFRADFDTPVAQVAIDVIRPGAPVAATGAVLAYSASGTLLEIATARVDAPGTYATAKLSRPGADISYVLVGGFPIVSGPPYHVVNLDNFRFSHEVDSEATVAAGEYFPLVSGDQWTYQSFNSWTSWTDTATVLPGTTTINGVATKAVQTQGSQGTETNYFTSDDNGIRLHRQIAAGQTVTFAPPIRLANVSATLGEGLATNGTATVVIPGQGTFNLSYSAGASIPSLLTTGVPAGHFDTVKVETTVTLSGNILGQPINQTEVDVYWLARHVGPVRKTVEAPSKNVTSELTSGFIDHDGDGISATSDNCPELANPSQTDTDGDGSGDACDADDDNDGVPDDSDVFPLDPTEWADTDGDGVGDNADAFPNDPEEWHDTDGDGVGDNGDAFPDDPAEWADTDADGIGNNADPDDDNDGIPDAEDDYPLGRFEDAQPTYWAFYFIETLARTGITVGCGGGDYCPEDPVTRAQMAVFIERGIRGSSFVPPPPAGNVFLDVAADAFAAGFIEQLYLDGITAGCGAQNYCPDDAVTRAQMAVFLLRGKYGAAYTPPPPSGTVFDDVDSAYWAVAWIERLAAEGITSGCGAGNYCPDAPVTRAQMAVFLIRAFGL